MLTPRISLTFPILSALVIGLAVGAAAGVLASRLLRINFRVKDAILDGILGAFGFWDVGTLALRFLSLFGRLKSKPNDGRS